MKPALRCHGFGSPPSVGDRSARRQRDSSRPAVEPLDECTEQRFAQCCGAIDKSGGICKNPVRIYGRTALGELADMHGRPQPSLDKRSVRLEMKLQAIDALAETKRLVRTSCRLRQVLGPVGERKRIAVPLKNLLGTIELREQRVFATRCRRHDIEPADFLDGIPTDPPAERSSDKLRP